MVKVMDLKLNELIGILEDEIIDDDTITYFNVKFTGKDKDRTVSLSSCYGYRYRKELEEKIKVKN
jgi:hypothetical protein